MESFVVSLIVSLGLISLITVLFFTALYWLLRLMRVWF